MTDNTWTSFFYVINTKESKIIVSLKSRLLSRGKKIFGSLKQYRTVALQDTSPRTQPRQTVVHQDD